MKKDVTVSTLAVLALASLVFFLIFHLSWLLYTAVGLLVLTLFNNPLATLIVSGWLGFSRLIGKVNSTLILTLTFYLFIFPIAVMYRIFNKKSVHYFTRRSQESYFKDEQRAYNKESFEKPF